MGHDLIAIEVQLTIVVRLGLLGFLGVSIYANAAELN